MSNISEIIQANIIDFLTGVMDSLQIFTAFKVISQSPKISNNIKNCLLLNGFLYIGSVLLYSLLVEPTIELALNKIAPLGYVLLLAKYFYYSFWLIPLFLLCNIITSFWIDEIYYECLDIVEGESEHEGNVEGRSLVTNVANQVERLLIILCFALSVMLVGLLANWMKIFLVPKFALMCILNSLYVFEYIIMQKHIFDFKSILFLFEQKFFYFFGFGIFLTFIINLIDSLTINSSIFLMAFPLFLISSVKVNQIRFNKLNEIKTKQFRFLYPIEVLYEISLKILSGFFSFLKRKKIKLEK